MRTFYLAIAVMIVSLFQAQARACSLDTIQSITEGIDPYYSNVTQKLSSALSNLALCDENLMFAGDAIGTSFDPYYGNSTNAMANLIASRADQLPEELANGIGNGLIKKIDLYYGSSLSMARVLTYLAKAHPTLAKGFALNLLKKINSASDGENDSQYSQVIQYLTALSQSQFQPPPVASSIWAFRSQSQTCRTYPGPWGTYYECPRYEASVADIKGNRIVLTCQSQNAGIEMQVRFTNEFASQIDMSTISGLTFGTESITQAMGVPYKLPQQKVLLAEQVLSEELLSALRSDKNLTIGIRSRSGEKNSQLRFSLSGSNVAIQKLMEVCL